eukprot:1159662-Pelagomonas_calceolata.AAC.13
MRKGIIWGDCAECEAHIVSMHLCICGPAFYVRGGFGMHTGCVCCKLQCSCPDAMQANVHIRCELCFFSSPRQGSTRTHTHTHTCAQATLDEAASSSTAKVADLRKQLGDPGAVHGFQDASKKGSQDLAYLNRGSRGRSSEGGGTWGLAVEQVQCDIARALGEVTAVLIQHLAQVCVYV